MVGKKYTMAHVRLWPNAASWRDLRAVRTAAASRYCCVDCIGPAGEQMYGTRHPPEIFVDFGLSRACSIRLYVLEGPLCTKLESPEVLNRSITIRLKLNHRHSVEHCLGSQTTIL